MRNINSILAKKQYDVPPEVPLIKSYIKDTYQEEVAIRSTPTSIIITTASAPLANMLQLNSTQIKKMCDTNKKLLIRIG
jgi:hypothetical protein